MKQIAFVAAALAVVFALFVGSMAAVVEYGQELEGFYNSSPILATAALIAAMVPFLWLMIYFMNQLED